jgi:hypothetical protein
LLDIRMETFHPRFSSIKSKTFLLKVHLGTSSRHRPSSDNAPVQQMMIDERGASWFLKMMTGFPDHQLIDAMGQTMCSATLSIDIMTWNHAKFEAPGNPVDAPSNLCAFFFFLST